MDLIAYRARLAQVKAVETRVDIPGFRRRMKAATTEQPAQLYDSLQRSWEAFKAEIKDPQAVPDLATFSTYMAYFAYNAKGRIGDRPTLETLMWRVGRFGCMYNRYYDDFEVTDELLNDVRKFVKTALVDELDIKDEMYDKEFADWEDVKILIRHLLLYDEHRYLNNRLRAQLICVTLLVADDGERIGAIVRSERYRKAEVALCYSDIKLFLLPSAIPTAEPQFEMEIVYNNRKGEREIHGLYLTQSYSQRNDLAHCIILWVLALAFLDDAFQVYPTPAELFSRRNNTGRRLQIPFKHSVQNIPIFRRFEVGGPRELSGTLPWTASCLTNEGKRASYAAGFGKRFTYYNHRRGVSNALSDSTISAARKMQIMGHSGDDDWIFRKFYQSRKVTVDVGNIFRKEPARPERQKILSMHPDRDPTSHYKTSTRLEDLRQDLYNNDEIIRDLLQKREDLQESSDLDSVKKEIDQINKALNVRRARVARDKLKELRHGFFNGIEALQSLPSLCDPDEQTTEELPVKRPDLAKALYDNENTSGRVLKAVLAILSHCREPGGDDDNGNNTDDEQRRSISTTGRKLWKLWSKEENELLLKLVTAKPDNWTQIAESFAESFPGRSNQQLMAHHSYLRQRDPSIPSIRPRWSKEEDELLLKLVTTETIHSTQILEYFPGKSHQQLSWHLSKLRRRHPSIPNERQRWSKSKYPLPAEIPKEQGNPETLKSPRTRPDETLICKDGVREWFAYTPSSAQNEAAQRPPLAENPRKRPNPETLESPSKRRALKWSAYEPSSAENQEHPAQVIGRLVYNVETGKEEEVYF